MKYYIPTSNLNLDNILQSESISPLSYYVQRKTGYKNFEQIDQLRPFRELVLVDHPIKFTINDKGRYNFPVLIEFEDENQTKDFKLLEKGVYGCVHTLQITPQNCRIYFYSEQAYKLTIINTRSNKSIKYFEKYNIYPRVPYSKLADFSLKATPSNCVLATNFDTIIDKQKGVLYAWLLGISSSVNAPLSHQLRLTQELYNMLTSVISTPRSFEFLKNQISQLLDEYKSLDSTELLNKQIFDDRFENEFGPRFSFLKSSFISLIKKWGCWEYLHDSLCHRWDCEFLPDIINLSTIQDFMSLRTEVENRTLKAVRNYQSSISIKDFSQISTDNHRVMIKDAPLISLTVNFILSNSLTSEYLSAHRKEVYMVIMNEIVPKMKELIGDNNWEKSIERQYINGLYNHIEDPRVPFYLKIGNKELVAIASFLLRGNSYSDYVSYLRLNEVEDYSYPLVLWGALCGYMEINRDFLSSVLSMFNYNLVYAKLFHMPMSYISEILINDGVQIDLTESNKDNYHEIIDYGDYAFLLKELKYKSTDKLIPILEDKVKRGENLDKALDLVLSSKDFKRAKLQCEIARNAYELYKLREDKIEFVEKLEKIEVAPKTRKRINEHFGFISPQRNKKVKKGIVHLTEDIFSNIEQHSYDIGKECLTPTIKKNANIKFPNLEETNSQTSLLVDKTKWIPICEKFITDTRAKRQFLEDMEWFVSNHCEIYVDKRKGTQQGIYYGKDNTNSQFIERLKSYMERKLNNSQPWLSEIYHKIPVNDIILYLYKKYGS